MVFQGNPTPCPAPLDLCLCFIFFLILFAVLTIPSRDPCLANACQNSGVCRKDNSDKDLSVSVKKIFMYETVKQVCFKIKMKTTDCFLNTICIMLQY